MTTAPHADSSAVLSSSSPRLRGRESEVAVLTAAINQAGLGAGSVVLVQAVAGSGKSRLLGEARRLASGAGVSCGGASAEPVQQVAEMATLLRALFDRSHPLLDRRHRDDLRGGAAHRYWLIEELAALIQDAAARTPMLLALDDLQWADSGTLAAITQLTEETSTQPIVWVLAARPDPGPARRLFSVLARGGASLLRPGPLDARAVDEVTRDLLGVGPGPILARMIDDAAGHPFALVELLLGLREEGLVRTVDGTSELTERRLPRRVRSDMRQRLDDLPADTREAAVAAASLGRRFALSHLATLVGCAPSELTRPTAELLDAGLFADSGDLLSFRHDILREAVRAAPPVTVRRALDRQAAEILLAAGSLSTEVAAQLAHGADPGDTRAIARLHEAATRLTQSDPQTGAELSQRALELCGAAHPLRAPLISQTTLLLHSAGRVPEAQRFVDLHLRDVLSTEEESAVLLSVASMFSVSPDVRVAMSRRALALPNLTAADRARHTTRIAYNLVQAGRPTDARRWLAQARKSVGEAGDPAAEAMLLLAQGAVLYTEDEWERALAVHEAAMRRDFGPGEATRQWVLRHWRSELLAELDRLPESMDLISDGITAAQHRRQRWAVDFFEIWRGRQLLQSGRIADAAAALEGRLGPEQEHQAVGSLYAAGAVALTRVAIHCGQTQLARPALALAHEMLARGTPSTIRHGSWILALVAMADDRPEEALAAVREGEARAGGRSLLPLFPFDSAATVELVRMSLAAGDHTRAKAMTAAAHRRAERLPAVRGLAGVAAHAEGLVGRDPAALTAATVCFDPALHPLALASCWEDLGTHLFAAGQRDSAVGAHDQALGLYANCGAQWDAARVRRRLRAAGVRRRSSPADRPTSGWNALTPSEMAVVALVADAHTNREVAERLFVSPHTVNSHLRAAFGKLGIKTRVELARRFAERDTTR